MNVVSFCVRIVVLYARVKRAKTVVTVMFGKNTGAPPFDVRARV